MTPDGTLRLEGMLDAFATAGRVLPRVALEQAAARWPEVGPVLLALLEAAADGTDRSDRTNRILLFATYLMAEVGETRAFRPLCAIAADGESMTRMIGDGVTEDLALILVRVYDGDPAPLRMLIDAANADNYARDAGLRALAWLTATGRFDRDEAARYLRELHTILRPQIGCFVWVGWQYTIAVLALEELVPLVDDAFENGWIDRGILVSHDFHRKLHAAQQAAVPTAVFERHLRDVGRLDSAVAHLSTWYAFQSDEDRMRRFGIDPNRRPSKASVRNPLRDVGRNGPCPCAVAAEGNSRSAAWGRRGSGDRSRAPRPLLRRLAALGPRAIG
jgi:hypothetical protein